MKISKLRKHFWSRFRTATVDYPQATKSQQSGYYRHTGIGLCLYYQVPIKTKINPIMTQDFKNTYTKSNLKSFPVSVTLKRKKHFSTY